MTDYQIQPHTRRCALTGRELKPGEKYYTALLEEGSHFIRKDYASEVWQGPPEGAVGFWSGKVPAPDRARTERFDDELLLECFERLAGESEPARVNFRYVVALLLTRRKRLRFEETRREEGREILSLRCPQTGARFDVVNPRLTDDQMAEVQEEVFRVLGWSE